MGLRQRIKKVLSVKTVTELDAFPKLQEECLETSTIGGTVSIVAGLLMIWLVWSETTYFLQSRIVWKFLPDTDMDAKLKINVDFTVAMPCHSIGADILDSTGQNLVGFGELNTEDIWFELDPVQRLRFESMKSTNFFLRQDYHALQDFLWSSQSTSSLFEEIPRRKYVPSRPYDACRIYGNLELNKVSGNFHVTAGKSLQLPRGHLHIASLSSEQDFNFSHRIHHFSFGDPCPGIIHPLEGDEKTTETVNMMLYQYFIEVVPTEVFTFLSTTKTYQYSVKDHERPIDHDKGSHGTAGIFFKYDMSALKVQVRQERDSIGQFLIRLCASVGGVYVTSGIINSVCLFLINVFKCKYFTVNTTESVIDRH